MGKVLEFDTGRRGSNMPSIFEVAKALLCIGSMTHKKLQKLCYYAQAWSLALYGEKLFNEYFEAWVHGPVCPDLYKVYKVHGWNEIPKEGSLPSCINTGHMQFLQDVYNSYSEFSGDELEILTNMEKPWLDARAGLEEWEPSLNRINTVTMQEFYRQVYENAQAD
jgi:uncharacterized phage-associated protein